VDSNGLGISTTSVAGGGTGLTGDLLRLDAPGATFLSTVAQTFTFKPVFQQWRGADPDDQRRRQRRPYEQQVLSSLNGFSIAIRISASVGSNGNWSSAARRHSPFRRSTTATDAIATTASTATNQGVYSAPA